MKKESFSLISKITLSGRMREGLAKARELLGYYPNLRLISRGSELEYLIIESASNRSEAKKSVLLVSKSGISLVIYSNISPEYFEKESILRLLNIAQVLSGVYEFDISSIFPNLIHALGGDEIAYKFEEADRKFDEEREVERFLASKFIECEKEKSKILEENAMLKKKLVDLLAGIAISENFSGSEEELAKKYGLSIEIAQKALENAEGLRYSKRARW